jgi:hypothetical protein
LDVGLTVNGGDFATTTQIGLVGIKMLMRQDCAITTPPN